MNLENLGLVELNAQEQKEIDGGWIVLALRALAYVALFAVAYHDANCKQCAK